MMIESTTVSLGWGHMEIPGIIFLLIWVLITRIGTFVKTQRTVHLKSLVSTVYKLSHKKNMLTII